MFIVISKFIISIFLGMHGFCLQSYVLLDFSFAGSGSSYLYGFFDQAWKEGMTKDEAEVCAWILTALLLLS